MSDLWMGVIWGVVGTLLAEGLLIAAAYFFLRNLRITG